MAGRVPSVQDVYARLNRGYFHLTEFERLVRGHANRDNYVLASDEQYEGRTHRVHLRLLSRPSYWEWALALGDGYHNLRSAMDHATYLAAQLDDQWVMTPTTEKKLQFPIADTPEKYTEALSRTIGKLDPKFLDVVEKVQPFNRPASPGAVQPLSALRELNNRDKHRSLNFVALGLVDLTPHLKAGTTSVLVATDVRPARLSHEASTHVCTLTFDRPSPNIDVVCDLTATALLDEPGYPPNVTALNRLIYDEVRLVVETLLGYLLPESASRLKELRNTSAQPSAFYDTPPGPTAAAPL